LLDDFKVDLGYRRNVKNPEQTLRILDLRDVLGGRASDRLALLKSLWVEQRKGFAGMA
jgi:hypothetical protein